MSSALSFVNVISWTPEQVLSWLKGLDCMQTSYLDIFTTANLNGKQLLLVTSSELSRMGIVKIGHQENILQAISLLQTLQYELSSETLLTLVLKLDSLPRNLYNELKSMMSQRQQFPQPTEEFELSLILCIRKNVSDITDAVKKIIRWIDSMLGEKGKQKMQLDALRFSLWETTGKLLSFARSNTPDIQSVMQQCEIMWKLCDQAIVENTDSLAITPATLEIVTIQKKHDEDLGMSFVSSYKGVHTVESIKAGSAADQCHRLYMGDEIVQINSKTVSGWSRESFVAMLKEDNKSLTLTLRKNPQHISLSGGVGGAKRGVGGAVKQLKGAGFPVQMSRKDKRRSHLLKHSPLVDTDDIRDVFTTHLHYVAVMFREPEPGHAGVLSGGSATDYEDDVGNVSDREVFGEGAGTPIDTARSRDMWRRTTVTDKQRRATVSGGSPTLTTRSISLVDPDINDKQSGSHGISSTRPKSYFPGVVSSGTPILRKAPQKKDNETEIQETFGRKQKLSSKYSSEDDDIFYSVPQETRSPKSPKSPKQAEPSQVLHGILKASNPGVRKSSEESEIKETKKSNTSTSEPLKNIPEIRRESMEKELERRIDDTIDPAVELRGKKSTLTVEVLSGRKSSEFSDDGSVSGDRLCNPWMERFSSNSEMISSGLNSEYTLDSSCGSPLESGPKFSASPEPQKNRLGLKPQFGFESPLSGKLSPTRLGFVQTENKSPVNTGTLKVSSEIMQKSGDTQPIDTAGENIQNLREMLPKSPIRSPKPESLASPSAGQDTMKQEKSEISCKSPSRNLLSPPTQEHQPQTSPTAKPADPPRSPKFISPNRPPRPVKATPTNVNDPGHKPPQEISEKIENNNNKVKNSAKISPTGLGNLNPQQLDRIMFEKLSRKSSASSSGSNADSISQHSRNTSSSESYDFNVPVHNSSFSSGSQRSNETAPTSKEPTYPRRPSDYTACTSREEAGFDQKTPPRRTSDSTYKEIVEDYDWSSPRLLGVMRIDSRKRGEMAHQEKLESAAASLSSNSGVADVGGAIGQRFSRQSRLSSSGGGGIMSLIGTLPRASTTKYDSDSLSTSSSNIASLPRKKNPMKKIMGVSRKISCKDLGGGDCRGWLWKKMEGGGGGLKLNKWSKFWFVLHHKNLFYFRDPEDLKAQGVIHLPGFTVSPAYDITSRRFAFKVYHPAAATFIFASENQEDMAKWMNKMGVASLADFNSEAVKTTAGFEKPVIDSHAHHTLLSPTSYLSTSSSTRPQHHMVMTYFSESDDDGLDSSSASSMQSSVTSSREDLTDMYRHIRKADLDLSGSNVQTKRSGHLAGASFVSKPQKIEGVDREEYYKLLSLTRTLKDKENQLESISDLLSNDPITSDQLTEFNHSHDDVMDDVYERKQSRDGDSVNSD